MKGTLTEYKYLWLVAFAAILMTLPFIGLADFSTKGEPREALVAVNMLKSHNWILPIDAAGDMAYKPPMFHWLIAIPSALWGNVTEFWSRFPSAIAYIVTVIATYLFYYQKSKSSVNQGNSSLITVFVLMTSFEFYRAGCNCRVDMLLTMWIVLSLMVLYKASSCSSKHYILWYFAAIICMSGGTLTKGPVGIILPVGVYWIYNLMRGRNFIKTSLTSLVLAITACVIPFIWYYAAAIQGGDKFITLAVEENFGRFLGRMSYDSHVKPIWYNFFSILSGFLPWSAIALISLIFTLNRLKNHINLLPTCTLKGIKQRISNINTIKLFSAVAIIFIFVFYCLPKSKRSVYLLPMYPFMAYFMAKYCEWMIRQGITTFKKIKILTITICMLFAIGYGVAFAIYANRKSDKVKAAEIVKHTGNDTPLYSYLPSRFMRYYCLDYYLGGRIVPLVPSLQVMDGNNKFNANDITVELLKIPKGKNFYLLLGSEHLTEKNSIIRQWIANNGFVWEQIYTSTDKTNDAHEIVSVIKVTKP